MKTVNSVSGGKTSSFLAKHYPADYDVFSLVCLDDWDTAPKDPALVQYVNAKLEKFIEKYGEFRGTAEDDATLVVMMNLEQYLGREITWVRGSSFDKLIDEPSFFGGKSSRLPSWARRYCTTEMKLLPIFEWWFREIGEEVKMRIGFRADEFDRMERFMNNKPTTFRYPVACSLKGERRQRHETFNWRFCTFPLVKDRVNQGGVSEYWEKNGYIGKDTLFEKRIKIEFPVVSNCVGCFHKKADTLAVMWNLHPDKMAWFARQEQKDMGTWLDSKTTYAEIGEHALNTPYTVDMIREMGAACDSGGCTD